MNKFEIQDELDHLRDLLDEWKEKQIDDDQFYYEAIGILNYMEEEFGP